MRVVLLLTLFASCRIYEPTIVDCRIRCGVSGDCARDTYCTDEGFCRPRDAVGTCTCFPGQTEDCPLSSPMVGGVCSGGKRTCGEDRQWSVCEGAVKPGIEYCNGIDDDCDGVIDSNPIDAPRCSLTLGVCQGVRFASCIGGAYQPCSQIEYGRDYELVETKCDGLDNDCDGNVDGIPFVDVLDVDEERFFMNDMAGSLVVVSSSGGRTRITTLSANLIVLRTQWLEERLPDSFAVNGGSHVMAWREDGGVRLRNAGVDTFEPSWTGGGQVAVTRTHAAMNVGTRVEVRAFAPAAPVEVVGESDGGTLWWTPTNEGLLSWPGGIWHVESSSHLVLAPLPPIVGIVRGAAFVSAVPSEPGGFLYSNLLTGFATKPLAKTLINTSTTTDLEGMVVLGTAQDELWLTTTTNAVQLGVFPGARDPQVLWQQNGIGYVVAFTRNGRLWLGRPCLQ